LSVSLGALAILVPLMGEEYLQILDRAAGGIEGALRPFRTVARVSGAKAIWSFVAVVGFEVQGPWPRGAWVLQSMALGIIAGLLVWAVVGTMQLVEITAGHGSDRAALLRGIQEARRQARELKVPPKNRLA
jgi:hypothetical protein